MSAAKIIVRTAPYGVEHIESRFEALLGAPLARLARDIGHLIPIAGVDIFSLEVVQFEALVKLNGTCTATEYFAAPPAMDTKLGRNRDVGLFG